jgi:hypothetical protein
MGEHDIQGHRATHRSIGKSIITVNLLGCESVLSLAVFSGRLNSNEQPRVQPTNIDLSWQRVMIELIVDIDRSVGRSGTVRPASVLDNGHAQRTALDSVLIDERRSLAVRPFVSPITSPDQRVRVLSKAIAIASIRTRVSSLR